MTIIEIVDQLERLAVEAGEPEAVGSQAGATAASLRRLVETGAGWPQDLLELLAHRDGGEFGSLRVFSTADHLEEVEQVQAARDAFRDNGRDDDVLPVAEWLANPGYYYFDTTGAALGDDEGPGYCLDDAGELTRFASLAEILTAEIDQLRVRGVMKSADRVAAFERFAMTQSVEQTLSLALILATRPRDARELDALRTAVVARWASLPSEHAGASERLAKALGIPLGA
ncbi:MAG: hypothetical protein R2939_03445 [Kofleriaceae bacterium]